MSLDERVAALEKGFVAMQQELQEYRSQATSSNTLGILNKVLASQELRYREIEENETMLLGVVSHLQRDITTLQEDMSALKDGMATVNGKLDRILQLLTNRS